MDLVLSKLAEVRRVVEHARSMPMSASCVVNREELLGLLDDLRGMLPEAMTQAQGVLRDAGAVVEQGRQEAARIVAQAHEERARLLSDEQVYALAVSEAERLVAEAQASAETMRAEVEHYVDAKLANFEIVLAKTLRAVERGRDRLAGRDELAELNDPDEPAPGIARG
jgi:cell division septum initiation protein DivIVA